MDSISIRKAEPADAEDISSLAYQSKSHWGYPDEWLNLWEADLKVTAAAIEMNPGWVMYQNNTLCGFCRIAGEGDSLEIEHMWIHPSSMGKGLGTRLLIHSLKETIHKLQKTIHSKIRNIIVVSDPNAVEFYKNFGFRQSGWESSSPGDRRLPVLSVSLNKINHAI